MGMMGTGPTAIVTGGATSIGAEIVRSFAAAGYRVAIADIARAEGEALAGSIGPQACFLATDLAVDDDIARCVSKTVATFGKISVIIHAACSYVDGGVAASRSDWRRSLDVNLVGAALLVREARPHLLTGRLDRVHRQYFGQDWPAGSMALSGRQGGSASTCEVHGARFRAIGNPSELVVARENLERPAAAQA